MSDKLMDTLRESLLLERAQKIFLIAELADGDEAINAIKDILRITRDEGIQTGQKNLPVGLRGVKYSEELEKAS